MASLLQIPEIKTNMNYYHALELTPTDEHKQAIATLKT